MQPKLYLPFLNLQQRVKGSPIIIHATNLQPPRSVDSKKKKKNYNNNNWFYGKYLLVDIYIFCKNENFQQCDDPENFKSSNIPDTEEKRTKGTRSRRGA